MQIEQLSRRKLFRPEIFLPLFLVVLISSAIVGVIASWHPLASIGFVLGVCILFAMFFWPDTSTLIVVFIIYTNAAVVAVRFHNLPLSIGASLPILLLVPLLYHLVVKRENLRVDFVLLLVVVFLVIQIFSAIFSENIRLTISELITFLIEGLGIYALMINVVRTKEVLRRAVWILIFAGAIMGGFSLFQQVTGTFDNNYWGFAQVGDTGFGTGVETLQGELEQPRLAGPIGEKNRYAQIMLMLVPLGFFRYWSEESRWLRLVAVVFTILILAGSALSFSRGGAVGFALMLVIILFMRYVKIYQLAIVVLGAAVVLMVFPQYGKRLASLGDLSGLVSTGNVSAISTADGAIRGRATEMLAAALVFADNPVTGVGPGMFKYYSQEYGREIGLKALSGEREAHNLYLGIAAETGIFGLLCFLLILFITLRNLARIRKYWLNKSSESANMVTGFLLAILCYMTTGVFLHLSFIRYFWLILALGGAANLILGESEFAERSVY